MNYNKLDSIQKKEMLFGFRIIVSKKPPLDVGDKIDIHSTPSGDNYFYNLAISRARLENLDLEIKKANLFLWGGICGSILMIVAVVICLFIAL